MLLVMSGKNILITGSTGFIGRNLIAKDTSNNYIQLNRDICDLSKPISFLKLPSIDIDVVIHLATSRHIHEFPQYARDIFMINVSATQDLLEYSQLSGVKKFILISTENVGTEIYPSFYTTTKICAELLVESYRRFMDIIILRPIYVYGPGQETNRLIPRMIDNILNQRPIFLNGLNGIYISPIYIDDMVTCIQKSIDYQGRFPCFTVSGYEDITIRDIAEYIGELVGIDPIFEQKPNSDISIDMFAKTLFMEELCMPKVSTKDGISRVIKNVIKE
jgi:UDP-glucose 4-epimerase